MGIKHTSIRCTQKKAYTRADVSEVTSGDRDAPCEISRDFSAAEKGCCLELFFSIVE